MSDWVRGYDFETRGEVIGAGAGWEGVGEKGSIFGA